MPHRIAEKLRLTSALLGVVSRKDLAAAFRRANPGTAFDLGRADKWLQGRSHPRQTSVYEDWSKVVDLGKPGAWIAECDLPAFVEEICARHGLDRTELARRAEPQIVPSSSRRTTDQGSGSMLAGSYACYSNALSPYYGGHLIRGTLSIEPEPRSHALAACYCEMLPTGRFVARGSIADTKRGLYAHTREAGGDAELFFCLFPPSRPASILAGYMCAPTIIGPDPQPSVTRILMIRTPDSAAPPSDWGGYLPSAGSIVEDLARLGFDLADQAHRPRVDRQLRQFLAETGSDGPCQIPTTDFRAILGLFDRHWLRRGSE